MALSETEKRKNFLKKHGLKRFNNAVRTTEGGKKGKVGILEVGSPDLFASVTLLWVTTIPQKLGNLLKLGMGKYCKGPTSAAYWANKVLWAGKSGSKKSPPKSQRVVKGARG